LDRAVGVMLTNTLTRTLPVSLTTTSRLKRGRLATCRVGCVYAGRAINGSNRAICVQRAAHRYLNGVVPLAVWISDPNVVGETERPGDNLRLPVILLTRAASAIALSPV
jgi:hypothetical protein